MLDGFTMLKYVWKIWYIIWSRAVIRLDNNPMDSLLVHGISQTHLQQLRWQLRLNLNTPFASRILQVNQIVIIIYITWSLTNDR